MSRSPSTGLAWPFLIGSGRRRDYSTLLAPDFLVAAREYGILDESVSPIAEGAPARVIQVSTRGGRRLGIAYATRVVRAADLAGPRGAPGADAGDPRDEHSRPLRISFGYVCPDVAIGEPAEADLETARQAALDVYRRFLDGEERFAVVPSAPFPLRSRGTVTPGPPVTRPVPAAPAPVRAVARSGRAGASGRPPVAPPDGGTSILSRPAAWLWGLAAITAVVLIILLLANIFTREEQDRCDPTAAPSRTQPATPSRTRSPATSFRTPVQATPAGAPAPAIPPFAKPSAAVSPSCRPAPPK